MAQIKIKVNDADKERAEEALKERLFCILCGGRPELHE